MTPIIGLTSHSGTYVWNLDESVVEQLKLVIEPYGMPDGPFGPLDGYTLSFADSPKVVQIYLAGTYKWSPQGKVLAVVRPMLAANATSETARWVPSETEMQAAALTLKCWNANGVKGQGLCNSDDTLVLYYNGDGQPADICE